MGKKVNLVGLKFGRLSVVEETKQRYSNGTILWLCKCDCGNTTYVSCNSLKSGNTISCGCAHKENLISRLTTHGMTKHKIHAVWTAMLQRCNNPNNRKYECYGGRGIKVCEEWLSFSNFSDDMLSSWREGLTLERKDVNRGYSKDNCTWATYAEQNRNLRKNRNFTFNGKTQCLSDWAREVGIPIATLRNRILRSKWSLSKALNIEERV